MEDFNSNFKVKFPDNHSIDHLKFVFSQAEKRLDDSNKTFDATTTKSITLITLTVALLSTLSAYFFINNDFSGSFDPKLFTVLTFALYSLCILIYLSKNILAHNYLPTGSLPSILLSECPDGLTEELHLKDVYYSELVNYDKRITHNYSMNNSRIDRINNSIKLLVYLPVFGVILYTIISFLSCHY